MGAKAFFVAALLLAAPPPAALSSAQADEIDDCEKLGVETAKSDGTPDPHFVIDRIGINFDKAEAMVGSQFVSSVIHGGATLEEGGEPLKIRYVCLHGGTDVGALFVWFLPD